MKKLLIVIISFYSFNLLTNEHYIYIHRGARVLGLGGAFTGVSDDENALFYNPAGLNRIKESRIAIFNPMVVIGSDTMGAIESIRSMTDDNIITSLDDQIGKDLSFNVLGLMPFWTKKNFAVAMILPSVQNHTTIRRNIVPEFIEEIILDAGILVGISKGFLENEKLSLGTNMKLMFRGSGSTVIDATDLYSGEKLSLSDMVQYGVGFDFDLGAMYTFDKMLFFTPTVGMSINNLLASSYPFQFGNNDEIGDIGNRMKLKRTFSFGSKFELPNYERYKITRWIFVFDINDIGLPGGFFKKVHTGTEVWFFDFVAGRLGINQGYITFGVTLDIPYFQIDFFTYAEELGRNVGSKAGRSYGFQVTVDL